MSPHALQTEDFVPSYKSIMREFSVTENGFLPLEAPLKFLPDAYYEPWERIIHHLSSLLKAGKFHKEIKNMPVLSTDRLKTEAEWRRAYVILSFFLHGYVWGGEKPQAVLPPQVAIPLLRVSKHLELPPVATYAALNLWNFSSRTSHFHELDQLESLHTFTGTKDEAWFYLVSVAMEAEGGHVISSMLRALEAIKTRDYATITASLDKLSGTIRKTGALLERMYEECDPMVFFYQIRPYLAGSMNMESAGLPNGVFYDEGEGRGGWQQLRGGSNGQSSLIQFLDVVLGVEHFSHGEGPHSVKKSQAPTFQQQVREYMPGPHARFLDHVARLGSIRELAMVEPTTPEQERLREAYQGATRCMTEFRNKHLQIVTRYIVLPSKKAREQAGGAAPAPAQGGRVNLASASESTSDAKELTGTGGTALMPFLKQTRDETKQAGDLTQGGRQ
ncbi:indoleamine 2,3-dioxygenase [Plectosphaerella plurivora]|uniref:Indoleamine 2,3-dioxygenase n=1 Tax=Plectosphaerella plurivora TaxID=936078 RepID=A0A9P8VHI8_9PEZI|nr:indoleamine 2,3-dioxygenase [Plectosphaerella plurivora]